MRLLCPTFPIFALLAVAASAQDTCPTIKVSGPAGLIYPGDFTRFTLNPELLDVKGLKFEWTVSTGTITSGQGTLSIEVQSDPKLFGVGMIASVEVSGLPEGCPTRASETAGLRPREGTPPILEEYGTISIREERERLNAVAAEWKKYPHWYLYFILYSAPKETRTSEQARIKRIKVYLMRTHKIPEDRLVFVNGGVLRRSTKIYRVP